MIQLGIDSFATLMAPPSSGAPVTPAKRPRNLLAEIELADQVGLDAFGVGEHHRQEFVDSAPTVILGAAATRTKRIRLTSAVTVLSGRGGFPTAHDPSISRSSAVGKPPLRNVRILP